MIQFCRHLFFQRLLGLLFLISSLIFLPGFNCGTSVKKIGQQDQDTTEDIPTPTATRAFTINFASRATTSSSALTVMGAADSTTTIPSVCGSSGSNCICDFFTDSSGAGQVSSTSGSTTYNSNGNYLSCSIPSTSTASDFTYARVRDRSNTRFSNTVAISNLNATDSTALTLQKILGSLSAINVRKVYGYRCYINYLQKTGTTTTSFDCTTNALSVIQVPYNYYLFADNISNNFSTRVPDVLQTSGGAPLCGAVFRFIDCTSTADGTTHPNDLTLKFGLFNSNTGIFRIPVALTSGPALTGGITFTYGYAATYDTTTSSCPPGFVAKQFYKQSPSAVSDSNLVTTLVDTEVLDVSSSDSLLVDKFSGGSCNGTTCTPPTLDRNSVTPTNLQTTSYTAQTGTTDKFCVISSSLLSGI